MNLFVFFLVLNIGTHHEEEGFIGIHSTDLLIQNTIFFLFPPNFKIKTTTKINKRSKKPSSNETF